MKINELIEKWRLLSLTKTETNNLKRLIKMINRVGR